MNFSDDDYYFHGSLAVSAIHKMTSGAITSGYRYPEDKGNMMKRVSEGELPISN